MKQEDFFELLGDVNEDLIGEARQPMKRKRKKLWYAFGAAAACLALVFGIWYHISNSEGITNTNGTNGVTISVTDKTEFSASDYQLIYLTEDELFTHWNTAVFKGTVTKIQNIELDFSGVKEYRALVSILVEKVYRGNCKSGEEITVLLPCPISDEVWIEDTETVSALRVDTTGIFMPIIYDDDSFWEQNGATLMLRDVADYGFADGMRYAFLETENGGVRFARHAYPSIKSASTLDEIEAYVIHMIEENQ